MAVISARIGMFLTDRLSAHFLSRFLETTPLPSPSSKRLLLTVAWSFGGGFFFGLCPQSVHGGGDECMCSWNFDDRQAARIRLGLLVITPPPSPPSGHLHPSKTLSMHDGDDKSMC